MDSPSGFWPNHSNVSGTNRAEEDLGSPLFCVWLFCCAIELDMFSAEKIASSIKLKNNSRCRLMLFDICCLTDLPRLTPATNATAPRPIARLRFNELVLFICLKTS